MIKLKSEFTQNHDLEHLGWRELSFIGLEAAEQQTLPSGGVGLVGPTPT